MFYLQVPQENMNDLHIIIRLIKIALILRKVMLR